MCLSCIWINWHFKFVVDSLNNLTNISWLIFARFILTVFYEVQCALFYIENVAEIFTVHYARRVAEEGFKMAFMMNKLAMINSCAIFVEKKFCQKSL